MNNLSKRIVLVLSLVTMFAALGAGLITPIFSIYLYDNLNFSVLTIGLIYSIYTIALALFPIPFGIFSDKKGRKNLFLSDLSWGHTLERDVYIPFPNRRLVNGDRYVHINVDTIDNIVSELQIDYVDFMKIDIMGAELKALKGAVDTLKKTKHVAVAPQKTTFKVREFLEQNGFVTKVDVYCPEKPYDLVYGTKS